MAATAEVFVGTRHGDNCTCVPLEPITFEPVIVDDGCPDRSNPAVRPIDAVLAQAFGANATPRALSGQVIITWPSAKVFNGSVPAAGLVITDVESGTNILTVIDLRVVVGFDTTDTALVELTTCADSDGNPILFGTAAEQNARLAVDDAGDVRTATTWWHVAEMRVAA